MGHKSAVASFTGIPMRRFADSSNAGGMRGQLFTDNKIARRWTNWRAWTFVSFGTCAPNLMPLAPGPDGIQVRFGHLTGTGDNTRRRIRPLFSARCGSSHKCIGLICKTGNINTDVEKACLLVSLTTSTQAHHHSAVA